MLIHFHENEILLWLFGAIVLVFLLLNYRDLRRLPAINILFASYCVVLLAWTATNIEHVFWPQVFNVIEHAAYLISSLFLLVWCWKAADKQDQCPDDSHD